MATKASIHKDPPDPDSDGYLKLGHLIAVRQYAAFSSGIADASTDLSSFFSPTSSMDMSSNATNESSAIEGPQANFPSHFSNLKATSSASAMDLVASFNCKAEQPKSLGDFDRLIYYLRKHGVLPAESSSENITIHSRSNSSSSSQSFGSSTPTSSPEEEDTRLTDAFHQRCKKSGIRAKEGHVNSIPTKSKSITTKEEFRRFCKRLEAGIDEGNKRSLPAKVHWEDEEAGCDSKQEETSRHINQKLTTQKLPTLSIHRGPRIPPLQRNARNSDILQPLHALSREEQQLKLIRKLTQKFETEAAINRQHHHIIANTYIAYDMSLHIFVDHSNINVGYCEKLKSNRKIHASTRVRQPPLSFENLSIILERGRPVARRVLAGSTTHVEGSPFKEDLWHVDAKRCGYEPSVLTRVRKYKEVKGRKRRAGLGNSVYSSTSDTAVQPVSHNAEQGVDEILHLKILESIIDTAKPSTMVVASGDANEAEYSAGFLKMVTRALERGWKVEIVSWGGLLSNKYLGEFQKRWRDQFKVVLLDDFAEELLAVYAEK